MKFANNCSNLLGVPFAAFIFSRLVILFILLISSQIKFESVPAREGVNYDPQIELKKTTVYESLHKVLLSADASWYLDIAQNGYIKAVSPSPAPQNWTFLPLFPLLERGLHFILGSYLLSGLLISNITFFLSLVILNSFVKDLGYPEDFSNRATWLLAFYPSGYFFFAPFTESLFILLLLSTFYLVHRGRILESSLLMSLATATRPMGLFILPAYVLATIYKTNGINLKTIIASCIAPLGLLLFMYHLHTITGDPLAFIHNQNHWGRFDRGFGGLISQTIHQPGLLMGPWNFYLLNFFAAFLAICMSVVLLQKRHYSFSLLILVPVAISLSTGTLQSMSRFVMTLFPIYLGLAEVTKNPLYEKIVLIIFVVFLTVMTALYGALVTSAMA